MYECMYVCMYVCICGKWVYLVQVSSILYFWNMNNDPNALATEYRWRDVNSKLMMTDQSV